MRKLFFIVCISTFILSGCVQNKQYKNEISLLETVPVYKEMQTNGADYVQYPNLSYGWGLKKNVNAPPDVPEKTKKMMQEYGVYYLGTKPKTLYLTFDEGYENGYTAKILDVLKDNDVKAAFFITGPYLEREHELVKRMVDEGHTVGNHTVNHPSMPSLKSVDKVMDEVLQLNEKFKERFSFDLRYIRPPKGEYSERTLAICNDIGFKTVLWSFAYCDWDVKNLKGEDYAYSEITKGFHDGAVLLLHAVSKDNANVLDRVIKEAKNAGYTFCTLDEF